MKKYSSKLNFIALYFIFFYFLGSVLLLFGLNKFSYQLESYRIVGDVITLFFSAGALFMFVWGIKFINDYVTETIIIDEKHLVIKRLLNKTVAVPLAEIIYAYIKPTPLVDPIILVLKRGDGVAIRSSRKTHIDELMSFLRVLSDKNAGTDSTFIAKREAVDQQIRKEYDSLVLYTIATILLILLKVFVW